MTLCDYKWELLEPNEEDREMFRHHWCRFLAGHDQEHQCICGARPSDKP